MCGLRYEYTNFGGISGCVQLGDFVCLREPKMRFEADCAADLANSFSFGAEVANAEVRFGGRDVCFAASTAGSDFGRDPESPGCYFAKRGLRLKLDF